MLTVMLGVRGAVDEREERREGVVGGWWRWPSAIGWSCSSRTLPPGDDATVATNDDDVDDGTRGMYRLVVGCSRRGGGGGKREGSRRARVGKEGRRQRSAIPRRVRAETLGAWFCAAEDYAGLLHLYVETDAELTVWGPRTIAALRIRPFLRNAARLAGGPPALAAANRSLSLQEWSNV